MNFPFRLIKFPTVARISPPIKGVPARFRMILLVAGLLFNTISQSNAEALLQLFNVSWSEVAEKMPELAEAGYTALWLPPPTKGSGGLSVGYDLWDPFDLGSKDQRGTVRTRYGTEADLMNMMQIAHRFGIRVYFDNIMNHRAFDVPGYNENTSIEIYPGMVPEDFHLRVTEDGFYRKWDNTRDWGSAWQVQNLGLADLIDIAHETPNANFGRSEGSTHPKYAFVRDLERPEQYDRDASGNVKYFGWLIDRARDTLGASATAEQLRMHARQYVADNSAAYKEDVGAYLIRAARWQIDRTKADGLRLDAVKHVPDYFFGQQSGSGKDTSDAGYLGGMQRQFNLTRGFSDQNHRDSVFDEKSPRDDAMVFGEHLGQPPGYGGYWDAGMRLVDNDLRSLLNGRLGNPSANLNGLDQPGAGGFPTSLGVAHANSHDSDYAAQKEWQHAFYMTREGMGLIYSDGFNQAETLGESGGAFPRHANTQFLGQFADPRIPNILKIHNDFARGLQQGLWADSDYVAFERRDNRNPDGSVRAGTAGNEITAVVMLNDNTAQGQARSISSSFPAGAYLYQYASGPGMAGFYSWASELGTRVVPPGGYFVFSYRSPEVSTLWTSPVTLHQTNSSGALEEVETIRVTRRDGRDGDSQFNPYGLPNRGYPAGVDPEPYTYQIEVPVVKPGPLTMLARVDGSAENILLKLDNGVNLNSTRLGVDPGFRDNPPGLRTDAFLGYEQPLFIDRQHPEKFAAKDTTRCKIGSPGAETYLKTMGGESTINPGPAGSNNYGTSGGNVASWVYHDPEASVEGPSGTSGVGDKQFNDTGAEITIWAKADQVGTGFKMFVYYTIDGSFPEGAGGIGRGTTRVAELGWRHNQTASPAGGWWGSAGIPKPETGTTVSYKIGLARTGSPSWFPSDPSSVSYKGAMMTTFRAEIDPASVQHFPHGDYARRPDYQKAYNEWEWDMQTGLSEGFHVIRARPFLNRGSDQAPIFSTFTQAFYYDAQAPSGDIIYPAANGDTVGGSSYDLVIRTDRTVEEVWFNITDGDPSNDDSTTRQPNGNGAGFEPFTDQNQNGVRDSGEAFTDINGDGVYNQQVDQTWAQAIEVTPTTAIVSQHEKEWRIRYANIPATGSGTITVRLVEASTSKNLMLTPTEAHATDLVRTVQTRGPDERVNIAWPQQDGARVDDNYMMKVYFTKALADGTTTETLKNRFTFLIASQASGSPEGAVAQPRTNFQINYNVSAEFHELAIPLPNLYNDISDFLHTLRVVYRFPDGRERDATRLVTANPSSRPYVVITRSTEIGSDGKPTEIILPDQPGQDTLAYEVQVQTGTSVTDAPVISGISAGTPSSTDSGSTRTWAYPWTITSPGNYVISATANLGGQTTTTSRNALVILREVVESDSDQANDDDNDGLRDQFETNKTPLPVANQETWTNGDVHAYFASGISLPASSDSDGDGLPDGLEVGWRVADNPPTDTSMDTNGDGQPNFIGDLDPPLYAVVENNGYVPGVGSQSQGDDRQRLAAGTTTSPRNPDTDSDGIADGMEDMNRNGWTDGDGKSLPASATRQQYATARPNAGDWPNGIVESFETWMETSPTKGDSDGDGLVDGFGEDKNGNGITDMLLMNQVGEISTLDLRLTENAALRNGPATSRSINRSALFAAYSPDGNGSLQSGGWPKLLIVETDPLQVDTDGDGLPDGWESNHGLNPLDNGTYDFSTGGSGNPSDGSSGDPDGDGVDNATELANGTHPNQPETIGGGGGEGTIRIGTFQDWTRHDLLVLDEYNEGGSQGADVFRTNGFDNSRDIVGFSFRDGGATAQGGDGRVYFRIDFMDLAPNSWQGEVDAYILIDTGNPSVGERAAPNGVDIATDMRWEAAIGVYGQNFGTIFVDTERSNNSSDQFQNPTAFGVQTRGFGGRNEAAWSSTYDALEVAVDRQNLTDAGWNGNPENLNFQVFTTMPNTQDGGTGDLSGRNDIRDTIYDDWLASDFWRDQDNIRLNGKLTGYFGRSTSNDRGKSAKVIFLAHGNQPILPASEMQPKVRTPAGAGYNRLLETHDEFRAPLTMHITPTLASGLAWASNPSADAWPNNNSGPEFNTKVRSMRDKGRLDITGSSFSDHVPGYFTQEFNNLNKAAAETFLDNIYGGASRNVFWSSERVLGTESMETIRNMGYTYTFADQMRHMVKWFGRASALGTAGYRINAVNGMRVIPIHDTTSEYLDYSHDSGSAIPVRQLLSRRARSQTQDQVVVLWRDMEDFQTPSRAATYHDNVRWLSSRPWIRVVTAESIANNEIEYVGEDGNTYTTWGAVDRGMGQTLSMTSKDWVDWATAGSYDNWFNRLSSMTFGATQAFGRVGVSGHANQSWLAARSATTPNLHTLAMASLGSAMLQTGFHQPTQQTDLSKFSTGDYVNPADQNQLVMPWFSLNSQAQARFIPIFQRVQEWHNSATATTLGSEAADTDQDGEPEYLLWNNRVFAVFNKLGGRMTAAWLRNSSGVWQVAGNLSSYSGSNSAQEGETNATAYRTSGFKDWWADQGSSTVNANYAVDPAPTGTGWTFSFGGISKTITLPDASRGRIQATYSLSGPTRLFVRFGLSPNLLDLMIQGNASLTDEIISGSRAVVANSSNGTVVRAWVEATGINNAAIDTDSTTTIRRRNQAQVHQVETELSGSGTHTIILGFDNGTDDQPITDGIPDSWWEAAGIEPANRQAAGDPDKDGFSNMQEYIMGGNPRIGNPNPINLESSRIGNGFAISFQTLEGRNYSVFRSEDMTAWEVVAGSQRIGNGQVQQVVDTLPAETQKMFYRVSVGLQ